MSNNCVFSRLFDYAHRSTRRDDKRSGMKSENFETLATSNNEQFTRMHFHLGNMSSKWLCQNYTPSLAQLDAWKITKNLKHLNI